MGRLGLPSEDDEQAQAFVRARSMISRGDSADQVITRMCRAGIPSSEARAFIQPIMDERNARFRRKGFIDLGIGASALAATGLFILFLKAQASEPNGVFYSGRLIFMLIGAGLVLGFYLASRGGARVLLGGSGESQC